MLSYMHAENAYFHQGSDLFVDLEPYMKQVASQVTMALYFTHNKNDKNRLKKGKTQDKISYS